MRDAHTNRNRRRGQADPLDRQRRRDLIATLDRDYARETRREVRAAMLDRFWDRRYA
jgi:hypothetical protein